MLTKRQHELLSFLVAYQKDNVRSPSYEEMRAALQLKSKSAVHALVEGLVKRKYCRRVPNRARALKILKTPESEAAKLGEATAGSISPSSEGVFSVPFYGTLSSAASLALLERAEGDTPILKVLLPEDIQDPQEVLSFTLSGDFLRDWGILSGDTLIVKKGSISKEGAIMLVSVGDKLMLRKWVGAGSRITLKTANRYMIPETHTLEEIKIHGTLVYLHREMG